MKNLLTITSALVLVISIAACKKEKHNVINNPTPNTPMPDTTIRLVRMYWEKTFYIKLDTTKRDVIAYTWEFEYDTTGLLSKVIDKFELIEHNSTNGYNPEWKIDEMSIVRDSSGKIVKEDHMHKDDKNQFIYTRDYHYNNYNELVKVTQNSIYGTKSAEYTWSGGRIVAALNLDGTTHTLKYNQAGNVLEMDKLKDIQYDSKPNYINSIKGLDCPVIIFGVEPQTFSKNNVTGYFVPRGANDSLVFQSLSLEYNEYGYVSKDLSTGITYTYEKVIQ
jgi:YD repeat-containing protein